MPKKILKDIGAFGGSTLALGAFGVAAGNMGSPINVSGGLTAVGKMMPVTGGVMMLGHTTRLLGKVLPKKKKGDIF